MPAALSCFRALQRLLPLLLLLAAVPRKVEATPAFEDVATAFVGQGGLADVAIRG